MSNKQEFNMYDWRMKHLFNKQINENEEPVIEEPIEEQPIDEVEKNENLVDEIGNFWVVTKPTTKSVIEDILFEGDIFYFANQIKGGLKENEVIGVYVKRGDASRAAKEAMKQRDMNLKEMEGAMNDFRESKKSIEDKKKRAAELIKKLK